jgi:hypothetical protein
VTNSLEAAVAAIAAAVAGVIGGADRVRDHRGTPYGGLLPGATVRPGQESFSWATHGDDESTRTECWSVQVEVTIAAASRVELGAVLARVRAAIPWAALDAQPGPTIFEEEGDGQRVVYFGSTLIPVPYAVVFTS